MVSKIQKAHIILIVIIKNVYSLLSQKISNAWLHLFTAYGHHTKSWIKFHAAGVLSFHILR
jgi:aryl-alcohol dehydrogenase-like predicted oxidoreductase